MSWNGTRYMISIILITPSGRHFQSSWRIKDQLDVTCYFISLLMYSTCFGHQYIHHQELATILLNYHIGLFFLVRCVLEFRCGWVGVVSMLQTASACNTDTTPTQPHRNSNTHRTKNNTTYVVIQQNIRQAPDDGYIDVRHTLSTKEVKQNSKRHQVGLLFFNTSASLITLVINVSM